MIWGYVIPRQDWVLILVGDSQPGQENRWLHALVTPVPDYTQAYMLGEKAF